MGACVGLLVSSEVTCDWWAAVNMHIHISSEEFSNMQADAAMHGNERVRVCSYAPSHRIEEIRLELG